MKLYYCPYCSPKHQIHIQDEDGKLVCGNCGDPLVRERLFKLNRVISLIIIFTFITPLFMIIAYTIMNIDSNTPKQDKYSLAKIIHYK